MCKRHDVSLLNVQCIVERNGGTLSDEPSATFVRDVNHVEAHHIECKRALGAAAADGEPEARETYAARNGMERNGKNFVRRQLLIFRI